MSWRGQISKQSFYPEPGPLFGCWTSAFFETGIITPSAQMGAGAQRLSGLSKATEQVRSKAGTWAHICWLRSLTWRIALCTDRVKEEGCIPDSDVARPRLLRAWMEVSALVCSGELGDQERSFRPLWNTVHTSGYFYQSFEVHSFW